MQKLFRQAKSLKLHTSLGIVTSSTWLRQVGWYKSSPPLCAVTHAGLVLNRVSAIAACISDTLVFAWQKVRDDVDVGK